MDFYQASLNQDNQQEEVMLTMEEYEERKEVLKDIVACGEAAMRLTENEDFRLLVLEGYLTNEPRRLADLIASGRIHKTIKEDCSTKLSSIGDFRNYMKNHIEQAEAAKDELKALEEAKEEAIKAGVYVQ